MSVSRVSHCFPASGKRSGGSVCVCIPPLGETLHTASGWTRWIHSSVSLYRETVKGVPDYHSSQA